MHIPHNTAGKKGESGMKKRIVSILLIMVLVLSMATTMSFAASKNKKMTAYTQCIKSGNTVYCLTFDGIYKVDIKKGKVTKFAEGGYFGCINMKLYKGYLYYVTSAQNGNDYLYRVKVKNKKRYKLVGAPTDVLDYAVTKSKIYYSYTDESVEKSYYKEMKLNGKSKKNSKYMAVLTEKESNASGYSVIENYSGGKFYVYLKTPTKIFHLVTYE